MSPVCTSTRGGKNKRGENNALVKTYRLAGLPCPRGVPLRKVPLKAALSSADGDEPSALRITRRERAQKLSYHESLLMRIPLVPMFMPADAFTGILLLQI